LQKERVQEEQHRALDNERKGTPCNSNNVLRNRKGVQAPIEESKKKGSPVIQEGAHLFTQSP